MKLVSQGIFANTGIIVLQFETKDADFDRSVSMPMVKYDSAATQRLKKMDVVLSSIIKYRLLRSSKNFGAFAIDVTNQTIFVSDA